MARVCSVGLQSRVTHDYKFKACFTLYQPSRLKKRTNAPTLAQVSGAEKRARVLVPFFRTNELQTTKGSTNKISISPCSSINL